MLAQTLTLKLTLTLTQTRTIALTLSHSQLYAETLLVRAVLTFAEEQDSLVSFVKGAFKIKTAHRLLELNLIHSTLPLYLLFLSF